jgi:hypothetical protein
MDADEYGIELQKLKLQLRKTRDRVDHLNDEIDIHKSVIHVYKNKHSGLLVSYDRLVNRFEANFKFHSYIKDVLDQTADLMENYNAVHEDPETVQTRVRDAVEARRTRAPDGASTRTKRIRQKGH